ncbi:hypothetical protein HPB48_012131 [Haemaphysalis longicornis]|uniref:RING-type domain-containing protein n=1 Tax=Haemaphysalis longicornis TaxID=44386 RepID=A0A9J6FMK6_HAELO|nr:hypothetical protein HPB48_012131 [Haemaphysalis longicornis]
MKVFVCSICSIVSPVPKALSCKHVLCDVCYQEVTRNSSFCPFKDGASCEPRPESPVPGICKRLLLRLDAHCPNAVRGCPFEANIDKVGVHFLQHCGYGEVACSRCGTLLVHNEVVDHWFRECDGSRAASLCKGGRLTGNEADDIVEGNVLEICLREFLISNMRDHDLLMRTQDRIAALATDLLNTTLSGSQSPASRDQGTQDASVERIFLVLSLPGPFPLGDDDVTVRWNPEGAVQHFTACGRCFQLRYFSVQNDGDKALMFEIRMRVGADETDLWFDGKLKLFLGGSGGMGLEALQAMSSGAWLAKRNLRGGKGALVPDKDGWVTIGVTEPVDLQLLQQSGLFGLACFVVEVS